MAHREWNPKAFFRHLTPEVLELLRDWANVKLELDGEGLCWEQYWRAWKALPDDARRALQTKLLVVNDMCSAHARPYLERLASEIWTDGDARLVEDARDWSAQDLAARLFIVDEARFVEARQAYAVDVMEHLHEYRGRYPVMLHTTSKTKSQMRKLMLQHFRSKAFGARCQVEDFASEEKFAVFVYHEDEMAPFDRFNEDGVVEPDWQRPVVLLAAVFHHETSTLLVKAPRAEERDRLRDLFADVFVGQPDYFEDASRTARYCFDPLRDPEFDFPAHVVDKIDDVSVVRIVARPPHSDVQRIIVEMKRGLSIEGVRAVLEEHGLDLATLDIVGVKLFFRFQGKGRSGWRTVSLFNPNSTNLVDTDRDRIIRRYLREWGIDAKRDSVAAAACPPAA